MRDSGRVTMRLCLECRWLFERAIVVGGGGEEKKRKEKERKKRERKRKGRGCAKTGD